MFLLIILKDPINLHYKGKCETELETFFLWFFNAYSIIYAIVGGIRELLKQDPALEFCRNQNKDISILTETHISRNQIRHIRNNLLVAIFFSPRDSHTK